MQISSIFTQYKLKTLLPIALIASSILIAILLILFKPQAEKRIIQPKLPVVTVKKVNSETVKIPVFSRGTIKAKTDIILTSEVQGRVQSISTNFSAGGFFNEGEVLLKVDPVNYELDLAKVKSQVSKAELNLARVKADVRTNKLGKTKIGLARVAEAKAQLNAAKADTERVKILLAKTEIRAPFSGRVLEKKVGNGQYISPGMQLGRIFATKNAEIHLPLSDTQISLIDVPYHGKQKSGKTPLVRLKATYGETSYYWLAHIVGTEGGVNARNRLMYLIAHIEDPFGDDPAQAQRPPLIVGKFVEAEIEGSSFDNIFVIPREAIRNSNQVLTIDKNQRLHIHEVDILYRGKNNIYIKKGLEENDHIVMTPLDVIVEGMRVLLSDSQQMELANIVEEENDLEVSTRLLNSDGREKHIPTGTDKKRSIKIKEALPPEPLPEQ
ncbi:MAG: efflux RND transporter periplasmic adaptor subunit [Pseudomonadales bacterium]|nr:efflux RND transporter periplasmic adaptor subunit [Pseudomonadales bacterium]